MNKQECVNRIYNELMTERNRPVRQKFTDLFF